MRRYLLVLATASMLSACGGGGSGTSSSSAAVGNATASLNGCQADVSASGCALAPLAESLSPEQLQACADGGAQASTCVLNSLAQPLANNDPTGLARGLTRLLGGVGDCVNTGDPAACGQALTNGVVGVAEATGLLPLSGPQAGPTPCDLPAGDPDPVNESLRYELRDLRNIICSTQRLNDMAGNPAFAAQFVQDTPRTLAETLGLLLGQPTRPVVSLGQNVPAARNTDPFRIPSDWESAGRGRTQEISFIASDGALLRGRLFMPNSSVARPYPGIVITTGSIQAFKEMYYWAAEGLAEAGYMVLIYDVQGQGQSEVFPHRPNGDIACGSNGCRGVPFQQDYNFFQGTRDAHNFLLSTPDTLYGDLVPAADQGNANAAGTNAFNPAWAELDRHRIGLAGHSLGASAVSVVGQELACLPSQPLAQRDGCVSAIVAWDALSPIRKNTAGEPVLPIRAPALSMTAEYFLNPTPALPSDPPNPDEKLAAYKQMKAAGVDSMRVGLRSSTHLEFSYIPLVLPASRYGERVAMYYTLAWFDRYVRGDASATERLTATRFDGSADASSIGAGTYDVANNVNVPYKIKDDCVANRISFYQRSAYFLNGGAANVEDMRARGCGQ